MTKRAFLRAASFTAVVSALLVLLPAASAFAAVAKVRLDMLDCNGDAGKPIEEATWNAAASATTAGGVHQICAAGFDGNDDPAPGPVVFTITGGPGHFTDASGSSDFGTTTTASQGATYNVVYLRATQAGTTTVRASVDAVLADGTKAWVAGAARTITLGFPSGGSAAGSQTLIATVRDAFGNVTPSAAVTFAEQGPGRLGSPAQVTSDSAGTASVTVTRSAGETGTETVTAGIDAAATDCERAAGDPSGAAAGMCQDSETVVWDASASTLTIGASPRTGVWGTQFVIQGVLSASGSPAAGRLISVEKREGPTGPFVPLNTSVTDDNGRYLVVDRARVHSEYRAVFPSDEQVGASTSGIVAVSVRVGVILNVSSSSVPAGTAVTFTGKVLPEHPGARVLLQQYSPTSGWRTIASAVLNGSSSYTFRVLKRSPGFLLFRTAAPSDADHLWNTSINRRVDWR